MRFYQQKDRASNQVYIGLWQESPTRRGAVKKTVRATDDIALDFDRRGRLVGIDISNASRVLGRRAFTEQLTSDELVGVAEAARICRVKKPNFIRDFVSRADFPKPLVELASGRIWLRSEIVVYLEDTKQPKRTERRIPSTAAPSVSGTLAGVLAYDKLAFRHTALTYFSGAFIHGDLPHPPTIEEITLRSIEEDREIADKAQSGNIDFYVEAAWDLYEKYSPALQSYLLGILPSELKPTSNALLKGIWVEVLRRIQRGEYNPNAEESLSHWLLLVANETLKAHNVSVGREKKRPADWDPLEAMVQARRYEKAVEEHERVFELLQSERLVLEYLSQLSSEDIAQFVSSTTKRASAYAEVVEAQRLLERRLREISL